MLSATIVPGRALPPSDSDGSSGSEMSNRAEGAKPTCSESLNHLNGLERVAERIRSASR